jgi:hypothetical protein
VRVNGLTVGIGAENLPLPQFLGLPTASIDKLPSGPIGAFVSGFARFDGSGYVSDSLLAGADYRLGPRLTAGATASHFSRTDRISGMAGSVYGSYDFDAYGIDLVMGTGEAQGPASHGRITYGGVGLRSQWQPIDDLLVIGRAKFRAAEATARSTESALTLDALLNVRSEYRIAAPWGSITPNLTLNVGKNGLVQRRRLSTGERRAHGMRLVNPDVSLRAGVSFVTSGGRTLNLYHTLSINSQEETARTIRASMGARF